MLNSDKRITIQSQVFKGRLYGAFPFFVALLFTSFWAPAQRHEVGLGLGGSNYVGDLMPTYTYTNYRLAGEAFYRYNLNPAITLRANLGINSLTGADDQAYDQLNARRARGTFKINLFELDALLEYNFYNYRDESGLIRWSPYFVGGVGLAYLSKYAAYAPFNPGNSSLTPNQAYAQGIKTADFSSFQPVIPLGIGVKYALSPQWTLGAEWIAHKTFTDYLDNTGALEQDRWYDDYPDQFGNNKHKDWYFFTGLTLSYTIWTIPCPFDYQ